VTRRDASELNPPSSLRIPGELSAVELRAAALDGELRPLGGAFLPLDLPLDVRTRIAALAPPRDDGRLILWGRCAAWIWGWSTAPCAALCCCVSSQHRVPSTTRRAYSVREMVIDRDEVTVIDSVSVTEPVRTLIDLARHDERDDIVSILAAGLRSRGRDGEHHWPDIVAALRRRPSASHARRAHSRLTQARRQSTNQPLLTR